jgi:hypothetical protein
MLCSGVKRRHAGGKLVSFTMIPDPKPGLKPVWRAVVEIAFIIFLFYSNLLMGEFTAAAGRGKTLAFALKDIFTGTNFVIAGISALVGYVVFEQLRKKL